MVEVWTYKCHIPRLTADICSVSFYDSGISLISFCCIYMSESKQDKHLVKNMADLNDLEFQLVVFSKYLVSVTIWHICHLA